MNKEAILIIGCMERYRFYKQLSGHEVAELFCTLQVVRIYNLFLRNYQQHGDTLHYP